MELDNIIKLINAVSDSSITNLVFEEGKIKLVLEKNTTTNVVQVATEAGPKVVQQQIPDSNTKKVNEANLVKSILIGVFYNAPSPDSPAFIKVGDQVKKGQVIGIIEAMKLMNEIECEYDGVVEEILVEDGNMVEYGQPLFRIKKV
ncbi:MAG: acetyl-CoA carboxylase biotin carboxyl carrier protein [Lachnotalea sp.]